MARTYRGDDRRVLKNARKADRDLRRVRRVARVAQLDPKAA